MGRPGTAIPKRNAFIIPRSLPIGSAEGFLLSCIDGKSSIDELSVVAGMPRAQVEAAITRLAELGAVILEDPAGAPLGAVVAARAPRPPSGVRESTPSLALQSGEQALDEAVDLAPDRRQIVLETFGRLDELDHYALLGVSNTAEKREVRDAYFSLSKLFHPDTVYGKRLGPYKAMMEAVFRRASEAYETLSRPKRREKYDASVGLPSLEVRLEAAARGEPRYEPAPASAASSSGAPRISSMVPRATPEPAEGSRPGGIERLLESASEAARSGDLLGAVNALRLAHEVEPGRADVYAAYRRARLDLAKKKAEAYEKQALREERVEAWGPAALSWSRVAEGRPDSSVAHRRAAYCILASSGDPRRARELAQRAVELAPRDVAARVTLARVYLAAGMKLNARRELEAAAKLDPDDEFVKNLLRGMK